MKIRAPYLTVILFASLGISAQEVTPTFNESTGLLVLPNLEIGSESYFVELELIPGTLNFSVASESIASVTPGSSGFTNDSTASLNGTWRVDGENATTVTFSGGNYQVDQSITTNCPNGGMETGTFRWDRDTGVITFKVATDENGDCGFSHNRGAVRFFVSGNTINALEGQSDSFSLSK